MATYSYETSEIYFIDMEGVSLAISWICCNQMLIVHEYMRRLLLCVHALFAIANAISHLLIHAYAPDSRADFGPGTHSVYNYRDYVVYRNELVLLSIASDLLRVMIHFSLKQSIKFCSRHAHF